MLSLGMGYRSWYSTVSMPGASGAREPDSQKGEPRSALREGTLALIRETGPHLWSPSREDHGSCIQKLKADGSTLP